MKGRVFCDTVNLMKEEGKIDFLEWLDFFENMAIALDFKFTNYGIGYPASRGKLMKYSSIRKKISKIDKSCIWSINLVCASSQDAPTWNPLVNIVVGYTKEHKNSISIAFDQNFMSTHLFNFEDLACEIAKKFRADYGYGCEIQQRYGPIYYTLGVVYRVGDDRQSVEEESRIRNWGRFNQDVYSGQLRDIYKINFLSKSTLLQQTDVGILKDWIKGDSRNGNLEMLDENLFLWQVKPDEIDRIRTSLKSLLISEIN